MAKIFIGREGTVTTSATKSPLQQFGSTTTATDITVPGGYATLNHLIAWVASAGNSTSGTADYMFRTEGNGLPNGPETWALGAMGEITAAAAPITSVPVYYNNVGLTAKAGGNVVSLFGDSTAATTIGASTVGVVCVFDTASAPLTVTRTYDVATSTTQTENTMTTQGSVTNASLNTPAGVSQLVRITAFVASPGSTVGRALYTLRISGQAIGTELDQFIGAEGGQLATSAQLFWADPFQIGHDSMWGATYPLDTPIKPTNAFVVQMANTRTNIGSSQGVVTLEFT